LGLDINYVAQPEAKGIAQALTLADGYLAGAPCALILGDNIFHGAQLDHLLGSADRRRHGATMIGYDVPDPERYGVIEFDTNGAVRALTEKPIRAPSNTAITGLYFMDETAVERAASVRPSARGELEITSVLESYLDDGALHLERVEPEMTWFDAGTHQSLLQAGNFMRAQARRTSHSISSPEQVAYEKGWIDENMVSRAIAELAGTDYERALKTLLAVHAHDGQKAAS